MTFSEQIVYAMFKPSRYKEMVNLKTGRSVLFIVVMMLVLGIVSFLVPTGAYITGFGGFETLFTERMGTMEYKDGELSIDRPFEMSYDYNNILIDTSVESITNEMMDKDGAYMAVGSKTLRMTFAYDGEVIDYMTVPLDTLIEEGFTNESLCDIIPNIYAYLVLVFVLTSIGYFIKYAVIALILSIFYNSLNKQFEFGLSYGQVFMVCFYGQTFGYILSNFNAALGLLPQLLVSSVSIFISIHMITYSAALMKSDKQV